ncbi:MAG: PP2C family protein-serine/threonine phosphatase [Raineya sp.]|jgi:sigma-B regulation protein RsbU (phosphoserine phosphatase)|nr:PP2C family protein-serine/threonine phosphatase [Raineya sp.]
MVSTESLLQRKELALSALLEVTQAINNNMAEDFLYRIYNFTLRGNLSISKMSLWVNDFGVWNCKTSFGSKNTTSSDTFSIIASTASQNVSTLSESVFNAIFPDFEIIIPIFHKANSLAFVFASGMNGKEVDADFIRTLTNILIVAIENKKLAQKQLEQEALRKELDIAAKVQQRLCPKDLPNTEKLQISAWYAPHSSVGGDYYDFIEISKDKFLLCIADVSGKGIAAAMMMANFQASLRTLARQTENLKEIVEELNYQVLQNAQGENFITFFVATYQYSNQQFSYINAGHNPPFLSYQNHLQRLDQGTTVLGIFSPLPFITEAQIILRDDFFIFAYTDGLSEIINSEDEQFGEESIAKCLQTYSQKDLKVFHNQIIAEINHFKQDMPYPDDITFLSCKINI